MAVTKIKPIKSTLKKALDYIQNPDKTDGKMLVSSFGCSYETADIEFGFTLSQALDRGNNLAHHLIQSFEPGEVDYEKAHEIGKQLADAVTKGQYDDWRYNYPEDLPENIINTLDHCWEKAKQENKKREKNYNPFNEPQKDLLAEFEKIKKTRRKRKR